MVDCIILCAGKGRRMDQELPKCLSVVNGKTILEWQLDEIRDMFEQVFIVVDREKREYFEGIKRHRTEPVVVYEEKPEGTWSSLLCIPKKSRELMINGDRAAYDGVAEDFVVMNGDSFFSKEDLKTIKDKEYAILVKRPNMLDGGVIVDGGLVKEIKEKQGKEMYCNIGAYKLKKEALYVFSYTPKKSERGEYEITDLINEIAKNRSIEWCEAATWHHFTTKEDIVEIKKEENKKEIFVSLLVEYDKKVLLQRRDNKPFLSNKDQWQLFGGKKKVEESEEKCIIREIEEELGIRLENKDITFMAKIETKERTDIIFSCRRYIGLSSLNEGLCASYFTREEVKGINVAKQDKKILEVVL